MGRTDNRDARTGGDLATREHVLERIYARHDVALVGGGFDRSVTFRFGDESWYVERDSDEASVILFANAYEATGADGKKSLFLVRALVPMSYRKVSVGKSYRPKKTKKGVVKPSPAVESFPTVVHSTSLTETQLASKLVEDGVYDEPPALSPVVLLVGLRRGDVPKSEWTDDACLGMLADIRPGTMTSATLNEDGRMEISVLARVSDVAALATDSVIAMHAYYDRMSLVEGDDWEARADERGLTRGLSGSTLYSLASFLLENLPGDPRERVSQAMAALRLRARMEGRAGFGGASPVSAVRPLLSMRCDSEDSLKVVTALAALGRPTDGISVEVSGYGHPAGSHGHRITGAEASALLGPVIRGSEEAGRVASVVQASAATVEWHCLRICLSALLGCPEGRALVADDGWTREGWAKTSLASWALVATAVAEEWGDGPWADWVASEVLSITGSVRYADALIGAIKEVCGVLDAEDAWDVIDPEGMMGVAGMSPDWAALGKEAREANRRFEEERRSRSELFDPYDPYYDDDFYDDCGPSGPNLYEDAEDWMSRDLADRFVSVCRLVSLTRHAFRHLDADGRTRVLGRFPALRAVIGDDGAPLPVHNDVVAAASQVLSLLATEDGFDGDGRPVNRRLPGVVMDDGSVLGVAIEAAGSGDGLVGRLICDGTSECYLLPAGDGNPLDAMSMPTYRSEGNVIEFLFAVCVSDEEDGDWRKDVAATGEKGTDDDPDASPDATAGEEADEEGTDDGVDGLLRNLHGDTAGDGTEGLQFDTGELPSLL